MARELKNTGTALSRDMAEGQREKSLPSQDRELDADEEYDDDDDDDDGVDDASEQNADEAGDGEQTSSALSSASQHVVRHSSGPPPAAGAAAGASHKGHRRSHASTADGGAVGVSRRSRPRASLACMHCRQRKVKCHMDAGRTPCTSCQSLQIPCVISRDGDRRKAGAREQVTALQDRVQYLESLVTGRRRLDPLQENSASATPTSTPTLRQNDAFPGKGPSPNVAVSHPRPPPSLDSIPPSASADANPYRRGAAIDPAVAPNVGLPEHNSRWSHRHASAPQLQNHPHSAHSSTQSAFDSPPVGRLTPPSEKDANRLDVDQDRGQLRFYGPTSQLHIHSRDVPDDEEPYAAGQMSFDVDMDSEPVRMLLLEIFWKTHHLAQPVVDQNVFTQGRQASARSEYYSTFLENSLLACATRMSTSAGIRALGAKYAERATNDVAQELQYPNIATLQGYLLLSDFESTRGRNRLGYMYCGMGCRLVFDLGLAESCSDLIAQGMLTMQEAISRHLLFLAAFVYDKLWGYYLGRPSAIPDSYLAAAEQRMADQGWKTPPRFEAWIGLCKEISETTELLNNSSPLDVEGMQQLLDLDNRIRSRAETLHPSLALHEDRPSLLAMDAYGLHVQMLGLRIVLHRTLNKAVAHNSHASMGIPSPQDHNHINHSRIIMHDNATRIARLISVYQQIFGVESIITIMLDGLFIAAVVLINHVLQNLSSSSDVDTQWLRFIAETLQKAQKHYPVTARMRSTLSALVEKSQLSGLFGHWANAPPASGQVLPTQAPPTLQPVEIFANGANVNGFVPQDATLLENPFGEYGDMVTQDMDVHNMMSWVLSPPN